MDLSYINLSNVKSLFVVRNSTCFGTSVLSVVQRKMPGGCPSCPKPLPGFEEWVPWSPAQGWGQGRHRLAPGRQFAVLWATAACRSQGAGARQALKFPLVGLGASSWKIVGVPHLHCRLAECWQGHASP